MNRNPKGYIEPPPVGHQGRSYTHEALAVITHVGIHIYNRCLSHRDRDYVTMTVKVARWCGRFRSNRRFSFRYLPLFSVVSLTLFSLLRQRALARKLYGNA